jgi:hypothetical protein
MTGAMTTDQRTEVAMHHATEMLHRQLYAYSDSWRCDRERSIAPWELEGWLETGLSIFRLIRGLDEYVSGESAHGESAHPAGARGREVSDLYEEWLRNAAGPLGRLNELEAQGFVVADAGEFREAERETRGVLHVPLDAVLGSEARAGRGDAVVPQVGDGFGQQFPA